MDHFPDAARRFRPFAPIGIKIFYFCIKQLNKSKEDKTINGKDMLHKTTDNIVVEEATKAEDFID